MHVYKEYSHTNRLDSSRYKILKQEVAVCNCVDSLNLEQQDRPATFATPRARDGNMNVLDESLKYVYLTSSVP